LEVYLKMYVTNST